MLTAGGRTLLFGDLANCATAAGADIHRSSSDFCICLDDQIPGKLVFDYSAKVSPPKWFNMKSFKQFLRENKFGKLPFLDDVIIVGADGSIELYEGRKWVSGRFDQNIGIDQPTHGAGQEHAHVYGRKNNQIVVVNFDGTSSHSTKGRLHDKDADALRDRGYKIKTDNIVEWTVLADQPQLLLG